MRNTHAYCSFVFGLETTLRAVVEAPERFFESIIIAVGKGNMYSVRMNFAKVTGNVVLIFVTHRATIAVQRGQWMKEGTSRGLRRLTEQA